MIHFLVDRFRGPLRNMLTRILRTHNIYHVQEYHRHKTKGLGSHSIEVDQLIRGSIQIKMYNLSEITVK